MIVSGAPKNNTWWENGFGQQDRVADPVRDRWVGRQRAPAHGDSSWSESWEWPRARRAPRLPILLPIPYQRTRPALRTCFAGLDYVARRRPSRSRPGKPIDKGAIYKILRNRTYLGEAVHKGTSYPGEHQAIIDRATWDKVQTVLAENTVARANGTRVQTPALLRGLIFAPSGHAMTASHTRKAGKLYRYYVATDAIRQGYSECAVRSVPAAEVEEAVVAQVRHLLRTPEIFARTWATAKSELETPERDVVQTITDFAPLWDELFPAEQARIVRLLVERIDLSPDGMQVRLRAEGLQTLVEELQSREAQAA
jgi:site-specific DNA recombinase